MRKNIIHDKKSSGIGQYLEFCYSKETDKNLKKKFKTNYARLIKILKPIIGL